MTKKNPFKNNGHHPKLITEPLSQPIYFVDYSCILFGLRLVGGPTRTVVTFQTLSTEHHNSRLKVVLLGNQITDNGNEMSDPQLQVGEN